MSTFIPTATTPKSPTSSAGGHNSPRRADFISRVVSWPREDEPGVINLHWFAPGKKGMRGLPTRTPEQFVEETGRRLAASRFTSDIYFCLSRQSKTGKMVRGFPVAARLAQNATHMRAVWADIDVKEPPKGYASVDEACVALAKFCEDAGIPGPTAIVASGGGIHAYWISDVTLTTDEWRPYAEGLKAALGKFGLRADAMCTADAARVLRVPDTLNYKTTPPRPVKLLMLRPTDISFPTAMRPLLGYHTPSAITAPVTGLDLTAFAAGPDPAIQARAGKGSLADGLNNDPLPFAPIMKQCPFFRDTFARGGVDHSQPMWNLVILASTFLQGGDKLAHEFGKGHPGYTPDSTDAMFTRKDTERQQRGLGWPNCTSFEGEGAKQCATCPFHGKLKSPLHLALHNSCTALPENSGNSGTQGNSWLDPLDFQEVPMNEAVARINAAGYFVLTQNGDIYKIERGGGVIVQKRQGFNNVFASRVACSDNGTRVLAGAAWLKSPDRCEYAEIGYWPSGHGQPLNSYNLWQSWGIEPKQGDWSVIDDHILNVIANGDRGKANYILDWIAHMVQRPWEKPGVALVLTGAKGTGKSLLTAILSRVIGSQNTLITSSGKELFGRFNWHLTDKLLIGAEEAFFAGNPETNDQLKHLITGEVIEAEQKYGQRVNIKSSHRIIMTSNHAQVIAASEDERRFFVCNVSDKRRRDDSYFAPLVRLIKGQDDATLAAFACELQKRDIRSWKPEQAARNVGRKDLARQKLFSLDPPLQWLLESAREAATTGQSDEDTGAPRPEDLELAKCVNDLAGEPREESLRQELLNKYRTWVKTNRIRGGDDYTGSEKFWACMKRLLNNKIFPGRILFRSSGGKRFVILPPQQELLDGFSRLVDGPVTEDEDETPATFASDERACADALEGTMAQAEAAPSLSAEAAL